MARRFLTAAAAAAALGCAAGPAASESQGKAGAAAPPNWADSIDEAVFGAEDARGPARAGKAERSGAELALDAARAFERDDLEEAARLLDLAARRESGADRAYCRRALGDALIGLGREEEAVAAYEAAVPELPPEPKHDLSVLRGNLAVAHWRLGDLEAAELAARQALDLEPENAGARKTLGLIAISRGDGEAGARELEAALSRDPAIPEALLALAEKAEREGRSAAALENYGKLLALSSDYEKRDLHRRWRRLLGSTAPEPASEAPSARAVTQQIRARVDRLESSAEESPERTP
jgi:predicted Zn-dependent protease